MLKKYNSWDDVKETFGAPDIFECEGDMFIIDDIHVFRVANCDEFVTINTTQYPNGIIIAVVQNHACSQYFYRKVEYV